MRESTEDHDRNLKRKAKSAEGHDRNPKRKAKSAEDDYRDLKTKAKSAGIRISDTKFNALTADVHVILKLIFNAIQYLGRETFSKYVQSDDSDPNSGPWRKANAHKAFRLMEIAARCRKERLNEAGWRMNIEPELFERFGNEVACKKCSGRIWRSKVEVNPSSSNSRTTSLEERQKRRKACTCDASQKEDESYVHHGEEWRESPTTDERCSASLDSGLSNLFSSRIGAPCSDPAADTLNPTKLPDRIHGLRRTKNLDDHLQSRYPHDDEHSGKLMEDVLHPVSLQYEKEDEELLYPFLIAEAKSEKSPSSFDMIEVQTCFPIKYALDLQQKLLQVRDNTIGIPGGPLVWFLANRGEDWRVYSAYIETKGAEFTYTINRLWSGSITGLDEALQLILIIDHIVDWARDTFRPNIIRQLGSLVLVDADDGVTVDQDVVSLRGRVLDWREGQCSDEFVFEELRTVSSQPSDPKPHMILDKSNEWSTEHGLVKDARRIDSRLKGFLITGENLETLLQVYKTTEEKIQFLGQVISLLDSRGVILTGQDDLYTIEDFWTGHSRVRPTYCFDPRRSRAARVYVQLHISYYIDSVWNQVRELSYLAVQEDTLATPIMIAALAARKTKKQFLPRECNMRRIVEALYKMQSRSVRQDLVSALCRRTYMLDFETSSAVNFDEHCPLTIDVHGIVRASPGFGGALKQDKIAKSPGAQMLSEVDKAFERYRGIEQQASGSFLYTSSRIDVETRVLWDGWKPGARLEQKDKHLDKILVHSTLPIGSYLPESAHQKYCLYIMDDQYEKLTGFPIVSKLIWCIHKEEVYSTMRGTRVPAAEDNPHLRDNRIRYWYSYNNSSTETDLKMSRYQFRHEVCSWIRALGQGLQDRSYEELAVLISTGRFTADSLSFLNSTMLACPAA